MTLIAVIDYDMGNLHSACKGLETVGAVPKMSQRNVLIISVPIGIFWDLHPQQLCAWLTVIAGKFC